MKKIPLIKPYITEDIKTKVCEVLDSGYLTEGPVTQEFENAFRDYVGCKHALAVCNCTVGLETALRAMSIGIGDEVIVPDYTYPATADAVQIAGAKIVIVDVDPKTMLIDYGSLEQAITPNTKAVIPVSLFGNPLDYNQLDKIKHKHNLLILEDAACSIGAEFNTVKVGNHADISVFSLHPRKFITTGEGGIITTNSSQWADWMSSYKHFGMAASSSRSETVFERIGTNYKLSNILAAVGLVQMERIEELLSRRRDLSQNYIDMLEDCPKISLPEVTPGGNHSYQSFCIFTKNRNKIITNMRDQGIEVQIGTYSLHMHGAFNKNPNCRIVGDMSGSRYAFDHCLCLPLYHEMTFNQQQYVVEKLLKMID